MKAHRTFARREADRQSQRRFRQRGKFDVAPSRTIVRRPGAAKGRHVLHTITHLGVDCMGRQDRDLAARTLWVFCPVGHRDQRPEHLTWLNGLRACSSVPTCPFFYMAICGFGVSETLPILHCNWYAFRLRPRSSTRCGVLKRQRAGCPTSRPMPYIIAGFLPVLVC